MDSIKFGANLFGKAIEMQTKTVRSCDVIVKIDEELSTMPEPFKMDFICLVTRAVDKCENMNDEVTKALEQTRWIPCSEKLPEKNMPCLVAVGDLNLTQIAMYSDCMKTLNHKIFYQGDVGYDNFRNITEYVKAWMPLPETYRTESEE